MPGQIEYCDPKDRVWYVSEVAQLRVVSPAIDGPNVALVIRFEREGEERFARWIGGEDWHAREALDRLFAEAESVGSVERPPLPTPTQPNDDTGVGPAPPETVALWILARMTCFDLQRILSHHTDPPIRRISPA